MAVPNSNYTTLIATTLKNYSNKIADNVVTNNSLLYFLNKKGNIKVVSGGTKFAHQILYAKNPSFQAISKLGTIDLPMTDPLTVSEWNIKILAGSIALSNLEVAMNSGSREKLLDLADAKRLEAEVSMTELMGDQVFCAGSGDNDFDGLQKLINEDPDTQSDVGGISSSSNSWWRNYSHDTEVGTFNVSNNGINAIDTSVNAATFGSQGPKLIVTTKAIFTLYMLSLTGNIRYNSIDMGDAGFKALQYATLPFVADDNCPAGKPTNCPRKTVPDQLENLMIEISSLLDGNPQQALEEAHV